MNSNQRIYPIDLVASAVKNAAVSYESDSVITGESYMSQVAQALKDSAEISEHFQNLSKLSELAGRFKRCEEV